MTSFKKGFVFMFNKTIVINLTPIMLALAGIGAMIKLTGGTDASWWIILLPLYGPFVLVAAALWAVFIVAIIFSFFKR